MDAMTEMNTKVMEAFNELQISQPTITEAAATGSSAEALQNILTGKNYYCIQYIQYKEIIELVKKLLIQLCQEHNCDYKLNDNLTFSIDGNTYNFNPEFHTTLIYLPPKISELKHPADKILEYCNYLEKLVGTCVLVKIIKMAVSKNFVVLEVEFDVGIPFTGITRHITIAILAADKTLKAAESPTALNDPKAKIIKTNENLYGTFGFVPRLVQKVKTAGNKQPKEKAGKQKKEENASKQFNDIAAAVSAVENTAEVLAVAAVDTTVSAASAADP